MEENRDFGRPQSATYLASKKLVCDIFTPLTVILYKRLEREESVREKMGAEQRRLNRYEQAP